MSKIIFETERLIFKDFDLKNFDDFCKINMDKEIMKYFEGHEKSYRECLEKYSEMTNSNEKYHITYWAVYTKENEHFIGQCGFLHNYDKTINLCYAYLKKEWGKGYGTEAGAGAIKYLFDNFPNVNEITAMAQNENKKSIHLLTKLGFTFTRESIGTQNKIFHYKLDRNEYTTRSK